MRGGKGKFAGVSSSYHVCPRNWIQVIRLGNRSLYLRGHPASPLSILTKINFSLVEPIFLNFSLVELMQQQPRGLMDPTCQLSCSEICISPGSVSHRSNCSCGGVMGTSQRYTGPPLFCKGISADFCRSSVW